MSLLTEALARNPRYSVRDKNDLNALLAADREQQFLGCDDPACYVDISRFVGAESIVTGKVGRLGTELVLTASRIDAQTGTIATRASAKAKTVEELGREMVVVANALLFDKKTPPSKQGLPSAGESLVAELQSYEDCQWAVIRDVRGGTTSGGVSGQVYLATFPASHFKLGKDRPLDEVLELDRHLQFLGRFPSCYARERDELSAFTVGDDAPMALKVKRDAVTKLRDLWRERKLELSVRFEIVGGELFAAKPFDWENCPGEGVQPFKKSDIAPNARIRVLAAELKDLGRNKILPVFRQSTDESEELVLEEIPRVN
jgi:hypothetical protein